MTIVIVDDSHVNLIVLKNLLNRDSNSRVQTFASSIAARDHLACNAAEMVIVDWDMPDLNGIEFIEEVRRLKHHNDTPIVMVTSSSADTVRKEAMAAGVTDFLSKPFDAGEFRMRIRNLLQLTARYATETTKHPTTTPNVGFGQTQMKRTLRPLGQT